ncbi:MAG: hypothetical protein KDC92_04355 [Bacteroidetes bacterium]|nr:hypothetical protein [Bacteroidota bacterium]
MKAFCALILFIVLGAGHGFAQHLKLRSTTGSSSITIYKGTKIQFQTNGKLHSGKLKGVFDSFAYTKTDTFYIKDLELIGVKNQLRGLAETGARIVYYGSMFNFGLGVLFYATVKQAPGLGLFFMAFGKIPMEIAKWYFQKDRYDIYDLTNGWRITIT